MATIFLHSTSAGLDPNTLVPGRDIVLEVDMVHGADLPDGVGVRDHLSHADRQRADELALAALQAWRRELDAALTVAGISWPYMLELPLIRHFIPAVADALGLRRALEASGAQEVVLRDGDERTARLLAVVAGDRLTVTVAPQRSTLPRAEGQRSGRPPLLRRLRNTAVKAATTRLGVPSRLARDSIVVACYWPLMPLFDALLEAPDRRPAVTLTAPPTGPRRTLRAARQGGVIGRPGPRRRARAAAAAETALALARGITPALDVDGLAFGPFLHQLALSVIAPQLAARVATAAVLRDALGRGRVARVVLPFDDEPNGRLLSVLAGEAGIPTLLVQHGAYFLPCVLPDLTTTDRVAIWSEDVVLQHPAPPHFRAVGYPLAGQPVPPHAPPGPADTPRVVILPQPWDPSTAVLDTRVWMRHCVTAIRAVRAALPGAEIVLRSHPADPAVLARELCRHHPGVRSDPLTPILELLATADLCVGATTSATLQAGLVGTPLIFLNVSGHEWGWPLGGDTPVPIARSETELVAHLHGWRRDPALPGRPELLRALGGEQPDPTASLLALLDEAPGGDGRARVPAPAATPAPAAGTAS